MIKYCKILNENTGLVQLGVGCNDEYYIEIGMEQYDVEQSEIDYKWYLSEKCPHYSEAELLKQAKERKIQENNNLRDSALKKGVTYKNILFDSDTDQKVNLIAMLQTLNDGETIVWYGMDNQALTCSKIDLFQIGTLITSLHNYVWNKNAQIQQKIKNAKNVKELNNIVIDYSDVTDCFQPENIPKLA